MGGRSSFVERLKVFGAVEMIGCFLHSIRLLRKYKSLDFYYWDLTRLPNARIQMPTELTFCEVTAQEYSALPFAEGLLPEEKIRKQFDRGARLFVVREGEIVIAMNWVHDKVADLSSINIPQVTFQRGTVYSYLSIVAPAYRQRGIGSLLKKNLLARMRDEGYLKIFLAIFLKEVAPHKWQRANGFKHWGRVTYIDFRVNHFWWTRVTQEGRCYPNLFIF